MTTVLITPETLPRCSIYILVQWPYVQDLFACAWFQTEAVLYQPTEEQEQLPSAYFVPVKRYAEALQHQLSLTDG